MKSRAKLVHSQSGFSALEVVLIIVVVGVIAGAGWFVWHAKKNNSTQSSNSQTSQAQDSTKASSGSADEKTSDSYLTVSEWGVQIPRTAELSDVTYEMASDGNSATVESASVAKACGSSNLGMVGQLIRFTASEKDPETGKALKDLYGTRAVPVGSYYYVDVYPQASCSDDKAVTAKQGSAVTSLQAQSLKIQEVK